MPRAGAERCPHRRIPAASRAELVQAWKGPAGGRAFRLPSSVEPGYRERVTTCPNCGRAVLDEAVSCPDCGAGLAGSPVLPPPPGADDPLQYTHSGRRYLLGYGWDFFGIWDRTATGSPVQRYPRTDEGWRDAWIAFSTLEPERIEVGMLAQTSPATTPTSRPRRVSGAWWLLPILVGWLGGLIAWLVNKEIDPPKARAMLITGIVVSLVAFAVVVSLGPQPSP